MTIPSDKLREMLAAATKGPWGLSGIAIHGSEYPFPDICLMGEPAQCPGGTPSMLDNHKANAAIIEYTPDLAAEVLRLREALAEIADASPLMASVTCRDIARAALEGSE